MAPLTVSLDDIEGHEGNDEGNKNLTDHIRPIIYDFLLLSHYNFNNHSINYKCI